MASNTNAQEIGDDQAKKVTFSAEAKEFIPGQTAAIHDEKSGYPPFQAWLIQRGALELFDDLPIEEVEKLFRPMLVPGRQNCVASDYNAQGCYAPPYPTEAIGWVTMMKDAGYEITHRGLRNCADYARVVYPEARAKS